MFHVPCYGEKIRTLSHVCLVLVYKFVWYSLFILHLLVRSISGLLLLSWCLFVYKIQRIIYYVLTTHIHSIFRDTDESGCHNIMKGSLTLYAHYIVSNLSYNIDRPHSFFSADYVDRLPSYMVF
jgi:hypothetical protein